MQVNLRSPATLAVAAATAVVALTVAAFVAAGDEHPHSSASPSPDTAPSSPDLHLDPADPTRPPLPDVSSPQVWASWAVLYRDTGYLQTGGEPGASSTASTIKVGIAADVLRGMERTEPPRLPTADEHDQLAAMIRDSDNAAAERFYRQSGGDQQIQRLIRLCKLRETTSRPGWWSLTRTTAADLARLGACIAAGDVASPVWAEWLLTQMRQVRGEGRFGFVETVPTDRGRPLAIKNGWILRDGTTWHVSCLAIADWWVMAALARYPADRGLEYGARLCAQVAAAWHPTDDETPGPPPRGRGSGRTGGKLGLPAPGRGESAAAPAAGAVAGSGRGRPLAQRGERAVGFQAPVVPEVTDVAVRGVVEQSPVGVFELHLVGLERDALRAVDHVGADPVVGELAGDSGAAGVAADQNPHGLLAASSRRGRGIVGVHVLAVRGGYSLPTTPRAQRMRGAASSGQSP